MRRIGPVTEKLCETKMALLRYLKMRPEESDNHVKAAGDLSGTVLFQAG
jgi:hypothetical protein